MTAPASIHPRPAEDLLPEARALRDQLGEIPARNRLMREYRIGAPKADALRDRLLAEPVAAFAAEPAEPAPAPWDHAGPIGPDPMPIAPDLREASPDTRL